MSAGTGYTLNRSQLLAKAAQVEACDLFTIEGGGSRVKCATCEAGELEHIIVALRTKRQPATYDADPVGGVAKP